MLYAVLCFTSEELSSRTWNAAQDAEVMAGLTRVTDSFDGDIPYMARLLPTTSAVSVRKGKAGPLVIDGPFVESKEHFVGFYLIDCETLETAIAFAQDLMGANPWGSGYEIRPVRTATPAA